MKIKKVFLFLGMVVLLILGTFSCSNAAGPEEEVPNDNEIVKGNLLSFNMKSLTGLGIADGVTQTRGLARSATSEGMLVKILEDGSIENFINVPKNANLSSVSFVTQSTAEAAKEIYIVFNQNSWWSEEIQNANGQYEWKNYELGQLLCVYEDGSYVDVLLTGDGTYRHMDNNGSQDSPIKFDGFGNMYYQVWENSGNISTGMIYKFDPKTGKSKQLTPSIPNTNYEKFYVSKDGNWIFAHANRWEGNNSSTKYLRAIPVSDANNPVNLFYDSTNSKWLNQWVYDDESKNVYFTVDGGVYRVPYKNGTYEQNSKELILGQEGNREYLYWDRLFDQMAGYYSYSFQGRANALDLETGSWKYYYFIDPADQVSIDYEEVVKYLFAELSRFLKPEYSYTCNEETGYVNKYFDYSKNYEIRFDEFENVAGFEKLAGKTKDAYGKSLTNENLVKALVENNLLGLWYNVLTSSRYETNPYGGYNEFFLADIFYNKETGEKINKEWFNLDEEVGCFLNHFYSWDLLSSSWINEEYVWKQEFLDNTTGEVNPEQILEYLAKCCNKGKIDFSLECFGDNSSFGELYTTLKNEEAIKFLDTPERRNAFSGILMRHGGEYFLTNTCFIPGTTTPAYSTNTSQINFYNLDDFTLVNKALYATDNNNEGKLLLLVDKEGNPVGEFVDVNCSEPIKVASTLVYDGDFYIKNAVVNASGDELGAHSILYFDTETNTVDDLFYNMPNNKTYEVVSYTIGGENLYCCLSKGTEISTIKINLATKQYIQLASGTKLRQIIIVK